MTIIPLRYPNSGPPYSARDGVIIVLYVREDHRVLAPKVGALFDAFVKLIEPNTLEFIVGGEEWKPLTPRRLARARKEMSIAASRGTAGNGFIEMKGGGDESDVGVFGFYYVGRDLSEPDRERDASAIEMWLPTEFVVQRSLATFEQDVMSLAMHVPFSSGYSSLAFNYEEGDELDVEQHVTTPLAMRHPGMDLHDVVMTSRFVGDGVRGAYWLTLVGPVALRTLGLDAAGLRKALKDPAIAVYELPHGVAIRAGDELRPGDVNRGDRLPLTRKVAAVLEPVTSVQERAVFGFDVDDAVTRFLEWQRRHLD